MITIQNISKRPPRKSGQHIYEICVTEMREDKSVARKVITTFRHNREDGMAVCLEKAAKAIRKTDTEGLMELLGSISPVQPSGTADPSSRVPAQLYAELREWMLSNDPDGQGMLDWSTTKLSPPSDAEAMAADIIWTILCAGRKAQAARTIEKKVWGAIQNGTPVVDVFGHKGKAAAIERAWKERANDFANLQLVLASNDATKLVEWCGAIPYVGDDTKFQLSKNFGADVCKPDIWLCRLAGIPDKPRRNVVPRFEVCMALCRYLAKVSGDSIATVDSMLWLACNKGVLTVSPEAGQVSYQPKKITARSIIA